MSGVIAGVDLGKSRCRVAVAADDGTVISRAEGCGAVSLVADLVEEALAEGSARQAGRLAAICVGAAGALSAPPAAAELASELQIRLRAQHVAVTSDAITSHAGALAGEPGVVTAVGTGAVTLAVAADGRCHRVDGWGQWLGDDGSGAWIGRAALNATLRAADGRGPATALSAAAEKRYGRLANLPSALPFDTDLPRATAAFVPDVVMCAESGDDVAAALLDAAVTCWVESTRVAAHVLGERTVTVVGGLAEVVGLREQWERMLPPELDVVAARGDAVAGALLLAMRTDLPHEAQVRRDG